MEAFEDLRIWQDAQDLGISIYLLMKDNKDWGFKDQIQRAAVSVSNNIAEGSDYNSGKIMIKYLRIAKGSCAEVRNMLYLSDKIGYCTHEQATKLIAETKHLSNSIGKFITYLIDKLNGNKAK